MSVTTRTLRLMRQIRIQLGQHVDAATVDLVRAWARAWDTLVHEWDAAAAQLVAIRDDGRWPTRTQVARAERAMKALYLTRVALDDLSHNAGVRVIQGLPDVVALADAHADVIGSQLPSEVAASIVLDRPSLLQVDAIVRRTTQQITSLLRPLSDEATAALYTSLVRGVALGDNPRTTARSLVRRLEGDFNGGLTRALVVARTEMLDAHRAAAAAQHEVNADVLAGWAWSATLDARTCPSCWSRHGTVHPLSEPGPHDHQQGRCGRIPIVKPWSDLGIDVDEPESKLPDAETAFWKLPRDKQLSIMGPERLRLLQAGDVSWAALSSRRRTRGWRDSWTATPVRDLA